MRSQLTIGIEAAGGSSQWVMVLESMNPEQPGNIKRFMVLEGTIHKSQMVTVC